MNVYWLTENARDQDKVISEWTVYSGLTSSIKQTPDRPFEQVMPTTTVV